MKPNGTLSNIPPTDLLDLEEIGDDHVFNSIETPLRKDAFAMEDEVKMELIEKHFRHIMEIMGLDMTDDSLKGTPKRVAKMFIQEVFSGLDPKNKPAVTLFDNKYKYDQMLVEKDISVFSNCEHHFVPIYGKAHVAYISSGKVIGLSKLNRIVEYYSKRPQVQERLTVQIANELKQALQTEDIAVVIDAQHMCVQSRGIRDSGSSTVTAYYGGKFENETTKKEFLSYLGM